MCLAYAAEVVSISDATAIVVAGGRQQRVILLALEGDLPEPGEWLLVQSGLALKSLKKEELDDFITP